LRKLHSDIQSVNNTSSNLDEIFDNLTDQTLGLGGVYYWLKSWFFRIQKATRTINNSPPPFKSGIGRISLWTQLTSPSPAYLAKGVVGKFEE
jgi:hypothetical protein